MATRVAGHRKEDEALYSALVKAAKSGDAATLESLFAGAKPAQRKRLINLPDKNGSTLIYHPVWPNYHEALRVLLHYGADVNHQNTRRNTALHLACEQGHRECIESLVQAGARIDLENSFQNTCLDQIADPDMRATLEPWVRTMATEYERAKLEQNATEESVEMFETIFQTLDREGKGYLDKDDVAYFLTLCIGDPEIFKPHELDLPLDEAALGDDEGVEKVLLDPIEIAKQEKAKREALGADEHSWRSPLPPSLTLSETEMANVPSVTPAQLQEFFDWMDATKEGKVGFEAYMRTISLHTEGAESASKKKKKKKKGKSKGRKKKKGKKG